MPSTCFHVRASLRSNEAVFWIGSSVAVIGGRSQRLASRRFRPLPTKQDSDFSFGVSTSFPFIETCRSFPHLLFRPSARSTEPTMPSADFCLIVFSTAMVGFHSAHSPGYFATLSCLCLSHLHSSFPYKYWILKINAFFSNLTASDVLPVRQPSILLTASFRFRLTTDTLAVRLMVLLIGP